MIVTRLMLEAGRIANQQSLRTEDLDPILAVEIQRCDVVDAELEQRWRTALTYANPIPDGETCLRLRKAARGCGWFTHWTQPHTDEE